MVRPARIFISYASEDRATADALYRRLKNAGHDAFQDTRSIGWGQQWEREIRRALRKTDLFLVLVSSSHSVRPNGYFQKEVDVALALIDGKLRKKILPIKIEPCSLPENINHLQAVKFLKPRRWPNLLR